MSLNITIALIILGGWASSKLSGLARLPNIFGMVVFGILFGTLAGRIIPPVLWEIEPTLKSIALIVILLRAGLGLSKQALQKSGKTAILMSFIPCILEAAGLSVLIHYFFGFDWYTSGLTAWMLSAVSPAVIVPSMLELKDQGYGKHKDVPSIILAGASVDDVFSITLFSIFLGLLTSTDVNILRSLMDIPLSIALGIIPGIIIGLLLVRYFRAHHERIRATEKTLVLLTVSILLVQLGETIHSAGLLGVMTVGFILLEQSEHAAHELSFKLKKIWIFAEIVLFVLIGMSVDVPTALEAGLNGIIVISIGLVCRSIGVLIATMGSGLNMKERVFCIIAYIPKATVQAALGSVALYNGIPEGQTILALAVLAIIFTAPLGLFGIHFFSRRLLDFEIEGESTPAR
jgi:NhaP-type Na+/H+ or K+/H+ antiporter